MSTIAAISTPNAVGGIAMIRISGEKAIEIGDAIFHGIKKKKPSEMAGYTCAYGSIYDENALLDDVVLTVFRAPHSYTGEDTIEITCHGGLYVSKRILGLVYRQGAVAAGPGEFTKRAFLNGKLSLSQAEAVMDLISAEGEVQLKQANIAKNGRLGQEISNITDELIALMSAMAYWQDDAEDMPPELDSRLLINTVNNIKDRLVSLSNNYQNGIIFHEGINTVLIGRPNAGKSSIMNLLCGVNRSIVTDIPGTTRDIITEKVLLGDYCLRLSDTAGIRETNNQIEEIGIQCTYAEAEKSDFILYVVDGTVGFTEEDKETLRKCRGSKVAILWNKSDLDSKEIPLLNVPVFPFCAKKSSFLDDMLHILETIFGTYTPNASTSIMNERQNALICQGISLLESSVKALEVGCELDMVYWDLEEVVNTLRDIDGENVSDDVVKAVFENFCVGK
ncbi:MAG: tRNA uridine-5-carboxymethylaminomethyl(34) synthesis GTPase MnmE [Oscillospiraceae bacterium]|nr:tRNA uridine-5-carboxymethylaminomethyl(34) synthesis GTPase MnmE [Oscillospiraceae bacterium]